MQPIEEIEKHYATVDPWGYQSSVYDGLRKDMILGFCKKYGPYERAVDIGCGEGWITQGIVAKEVEGYEVSKNARARIPAPVKAVEELHGFYDLVLATGIFYDHYDPVELLWLVQAHSSKVIIFSNVSEWESKLVSEIPGTLLENFEYPYFSPDGKQELTQRLRVWRR